MAAPLYLRIRDDLLAKIESGVYQPGETIPSELELADDYGVSRPTIRQALGLLSDAGVVERHRRRGTVVADRRLEQHFVDQIEGFEGQLPLVDELAGELTTEVLAFRRETPTPQLVATMELEDETAEIFLLMRLRYLLGEPRVIATSYTPADLYPHLMEHDFSRESLYKVMAAAGHPIDRVDRQLSVIMPETTSAILLGIGLETPCFVFDSVGRARNGRVVECSHVLYRGDLTRFTVRLRTATE